MMKKKYFLNAHIIDPKNSLDEVGGLIINENGKIDAVGKKVNKNNIPSREKYIDLSNKHLFPGIVDMRVFVGEPGYEYKENFKTLSNAALSGGVTSTVTMPNTSPIIDNVSIVDFLKRRGRDKSKINIYPTASLTKNLEGKNMTEFGLLQKKGIIGFTDGIKTIQNSRLMSRIMRSAFDLGSLVMQHAEDIDLAENGTVLTITRNQETEYPFFLEAIEKWKQIQPPLELFIKAQEISRFEVTLEEIIYRMYVSKKDWIDMLRNRFWSHLSELEDDLLDKGITELEEKYKDLETLSFNDCLVFLIGRKLPLIQSD